MAAGADMDDDARAAAMPGLGRSGGKRESCKRRRRCDQQLTHLTSLLSRPQRGRRARTHERRRRFVAAGRFALADATTDLR
jgi:hypothetical protein